MNKNFMDNDFIDIEKADCIIVPSILPEVNGCILDLKNLKIKCDVECQNCLYSYETYLFVKRRIALDKINIERIETALEAIKKSGKTTITIEELQVELDFTS